MLHGYITITISETLKVTQIANQFNISDLDTAQNRCILRHLSGA